MAPSPGLRRPGALTVRPLAAAESAQVPRLWNSAWARNPAGAPFHLGERLWHERLARYHDPELLLGAFDGEQLVGAAYGRASDAGTRPGTWQPPAVGWLSLLAVAPEWQGAGVGTGLADELLVVLRRKGCSLLRFGGEPNHLLPAIPQTASPAMWRLARRYGARFLAAEHDLHLDLRIRLPAVGLPAGWSVIDDTPAAALDFVRREFPGRWAEEVEERIAAGATALSLVGLVGADAGPSAAAEGFCMVYLGNETLLAPSLYWPAAGQAAAGQGRAAGMGPLGIARSARGAKLGLGMVAAGARWLQERGATDLFIDWTSLTGFYGRLGARVWHTYQRAEADIPELESATGGPGGLT